MSNNWKMLRDRAIYNYNGRPSIKSYMIYGTVPFSVILNDF